MKDKTGNRRFLILKSNLKENQYVAGLTEDYIKQFWAEIFAKFNELFKDGFDENKLLLSKESIITAAEIAKSCVADDGLTSEILPFTDYPIAYQPIWRLLSKSERRKFFENGGSISISEQDLRGRQVARRRPDELIELEEVLTRADDENDYSVQFDNDNGTITFYGVEQRDTICASEVFNECLYSYDRRIVSRIAEILETELVKEGWRKKPHKEKCYGFQPNTYVREVVADNEEVTSSPSEDITGTETFVNNVAETPQKTSETESVGNNFSDVYDDVTISSSESYYSDEEEYLTEDELREFHENDF